MGKLYRKIFQSFIALLSCMLLFAACGPKETVQPSPSPQEGEGLSFFSAAGVEGMNLAVESKVFYDVASELKGGKLLCMQFYQGEPVQFWRSAVDGEAGTVSVYMYRQDGTKETCLEGIESFLAQNICFRDSEGCFYSVSRGTDKDSISRLDTAGKTLYTTRMDGHIEKEKICELADGRLAMFIYEGNSVKNFDIALLDTEGKFTTVAMSEQLPYDSCLGASDEGLLITENEYIYRVVLPEGKLEPLFSFVQTNYSMWKGSDRELSAFCVRHDGKLELLRTDWQGSGSAICEILSLVKRDESRKEVTLRGLDVKNQEWLKEQVLKFNSSNDEYWVVIEGPEQWDDVDDYVTRTGVEIATGRGPDLLMGSDLIESPASLIEKGGLLDLAPLMQQSGMKEEDYFPAAFDTWRTGDSIYTVRFSSSFMERLMSSAVLGDMEKIDIEAVVDALLVYPENAVYDRDHRPAAMILRELLEGSETLWGMVDWEDSTCDFGRELFGKLLEVAKRYQYDARNNYSSICDYRQIDSFSSFYTFPTLEETRERGYVPLGTLFDDGLHPISMHSFPLSINANSANREGAWEFLQFLLSEEVQAGMLESTRWMPIKRSVFQTAVEEEILNGSPGNNQLALVEGPLPRERAEYIEAQIENVRALPYKTEAILEIVLEESQEYFDGVKEIPQVVDAVENRVGLYLMERR